MRFSKEGEEHMEKIVVINEKKYQEFKYEMKRENDYWTPEEIKEIMKYNKKIKDIDCNCIDNYS